MDDLSKGTGTNDPPKGPKADDPPKGPKADDPPKGPRSEGSGLSIEEYLQVIENCELVAQKVGLGGVGGGTTYCTLGRGLLSWGSGYLLYPYGGGATYCRAINAVMGGKGFSIFPHTSLVLWAVFKISISYPCNSI